MLNWSTSPMLLQLKGTPLEIRDPAFLVRDGVVPALYLALQVTDVLLQVPNGRVQLLVLGTHLPNAGPVLIAVFHLLTICTDTGLNPND